MGFQLIKGILDGIRPEPMLLVSDWADKHRRLTSESAAEPGQWRTAKTPFLKAIMDDLSPRSAINEVVVMKGVQLGFALDLDTPIPTKDGWKRMADIVVGDVVFDENGQPANVTFVSEIMHNHICYDVHFSDGSVIKADKHHKWAVWDEKKWEYRKKVVINTETIFHTHKMRNGKCNRYAVDVAKPLDLPNAELPIPPYTFGCWLGDGNSHSNRITTHTSDADEMVSYMREEGAHVEICRKHAKGNCVEILLWPGNSNNRWTFGGEIRRLGVHKNKHIPSLYLRASYGQRMELLRGLMDTDGHVTKEGYCEFYSIDETLMLQVYELIASVGLKPVLKRKKNTKDVSIGTNKSYSTKGYIYRITFHAFSENYVVNLARKRDRLRKMEDCRWLETTRRRIVNVTETESVPVRCISVDSPSHLYLAGRAMIPTHNTESGLNTVGCYIDIAPCPMMYVMPTIEMAKSISESRVDSMIENSPSLSEKIRPSRERDAGNTKLKKRFPGGILALAGANSAASLRSRPVKVLILDEVDGYPLNVDNEGSPISLAEKRTSTFGSQRKIYKLSTPTVAGTSVIEAEFIQTEQRYYHVPCPHCGVLQHLKFERLRWEKGRPETVAYQCEHCDEAIEERYKPVMLAKGKWIATKPENERANKRGYHINSLYSPPNWLSWQRVVEDYEKAANDVNLMRVFVNTILGETWKEDGEAPAWENLYNRRETYRTNRPPTDVAFLTAGVDVQKDRLEVEIVGWCKGKRSYSIDYRVIVGDTAQKSVWDELAKVVTETWETDAGLIMPLKLMAVDSGYNTSEVYAFCRRFDQSKVIPIKGDESLGTIVAPPRAVDTNRRGKKIGGVKVWKVGVSFIKSELYNWLRQEIDEDGVVPNGYCHFPQYDQRYFKGLTAEELQFKLIRGFRKYEWVKKYERNEPLDCRVYARAAAGVVGMDRLSDAQWDQLRVGYEQRTKQPTASTKKKSSFW